MLGVGPTAAGRVKLCYNKVTLTKSKHDRLHSEHVKTCNNAAKSKHVWLKKELIVI